MTAQTATINTPSHRPNAAQKRQQQLGRQIKRLTNICVPFASHLSTGLFFASMAAVLYFGWQMRDEAHLTAEEGLGYALGITGGTMMILLLLYPLRKKAAFMRGMGSIKGWFRSHIILGVVGPIAILYHSNFQLGSLNSNVALTCMLLVAGSGLFGRYIYTKVHYGLHGGKASLKELTDDTKLIKVLLSPCTQEDSDMSNTLQRLELIALEQPKGVLHSSWRLLSIGIMTRWHSLFLRYRLFRAITMVAVKSQWSTEQKKRNYRKAKKDLKTYLALIQKIGQLGFYERLFSLWHVLHFPLFLMMVVSGIIHVVAVHLY